ncbi:MAG: TonB-dependent receptor [Prevotellaceae bacterium]|nr:TonB-dependent receptor [Prevotellaceae bacterium]
MKHSGSSRIVLLLVLSLGLARLVRAQGAYGEDTLRSVAIDEVTVSSFRSGTILSSLSPFKTETITATGLKKMACCNLSESFENSASATVGFTDAVSGAKQIQLLGLSGIYSQTLAENIPTLRGLAATYGLSYIPAAWLESIQLSKGTSSVVNGYESITGQMNLEFKKPNFTEPLFVNLYVDDDLHYEGNVTAAAQVAKNLWAGLLLSGTLGAAVHDENGDGFLDMPKMRYVNAYNRWFYLNDEKGIQSRTGVKLLYEDRKAGQDSLCHVQHGIPLDGVRLWESLITNKNFTAYNKTGFSVGDREGQSIGLINSFTRHEQRSSFGEKTFGGVQNSYYLNVLFSSFIGSTSHRYTAGAGFAYDAYDTEFADARLSGNPSSPADVQTPHTEVGRVEAAPGVYGEYANTSLAGLTLVAGLRADYNSRFGWLLTPRLNAKYDLGRFVALRASAGRGFRSPNALPENIGLMASSRAFDVAGIRDLGVEKAWVFGGNATLTLPTGGGRQAKVSVDYYHTNFQNQTIVDTERDRNAVFFYSSGGTESYANTWQADVSATLFKGFDVFAAFRYNTNVLTCTDGVRQVKTDKPLVSAYRGLVNLSYATALRRWVFDVTAQLNGPTRLPGLNGYDSEKIYSPAFPVYFAQVTRNSKRFDVYLGAENMLGYRQAQPIRSWENPFDRDFDASMVWAPVSGARIYGGVRLRIGKLY